VTGRTISPEKNWMSGTSGYRKIWKEVTSRFLLNEFYDICNIPFDTLMTAILM